MSVFITTKLSFNYNARDKYKKPKWKDEMQENHVLLKFDCQPNPAESTSACKRLFGEKSMRDVTHQKRSRKMMLTGVREDIEMTELNEIEQQVDVLKKAAKISESST